MPKSKCTKRLMFGPFFGSWDVENVHGVVAQSTFRSQNLQHTPGSEHFWKLRCRKSARRCQNVQNTLCSDRFWKLRCRKRARHCGAKDITKSKLRKTHQVRSSFLKLRCRKSAHRCGTKKILKSTCTKHLVFGPLLEVEMSKTCTALWREAHFKVKIYNTHQVRSTFGSWNVETFHAVEAEAHAQVKMLKTRSHAWTTLEGSDVGLRGRRKGFRTLPKVSKTWAFSKNDGRRGAFQEDLQRCISRGRRGTRDIFIRDVRRSGRWFPERCCILEHQIFRFARMILRDRCSTSYDLASLFRGRRNTLETWTGKIAKRIGTKLSDLHSTSIFAGGLAELLRFWCCQLENLRVSQNCFVFDVVNLKIWGSLAELLRFWCCQLERLRKSRRIASFSSLQIDR